MALTPEIEKEIAYYYPRLNNSPIKVANKVGVSVSEVLSVIDALSEKVGPIPERHNGQGPIELRQYLVARRKGTDVSWNNDLPEIAEARKNYEAGTHIMATGRDGLWLLLYSIPRKGRPDPLPDYFVPELS